MVMLNSPRQMNNPSVLLAQPPSDSTVTHCQIFLFFFFPFSLPPSYWMQTKLEKGSGTAFDV